MLRYVKNIKANDMISSIAYVIIGLVLLIWPGTSTQVVCMVLGIVLLIYGLVQIALYLFKKEKTMLSQGMLILGVIFSVLGIWILIKPEMIIMAVPVIVGVIIIMHGLHNTLQALELKKMDYGNWWMALFFGILTIVSGVVLAYNPFKVVNTVVRVIGIFLLYDGISDLWILNRIKKAGKGKEQVIDAEAVEIKEE